MAADEHGGRRPPPASARLVHLHPCFNGDCRRPWRPPGRCAGPTSPRSRPWAWRGGWLRRPWACPPWRGRRPCRPQACPPWAQSPFLGQGHRGRSLHLLLRPGLMPPRPNAPQQPKKPTTGLSKAARKKPGPKKKMPSSTLVASASTPTINSSASASITAPNCGTEEDTHVANNVFDGMSASANSFSNMMDESVEVENISLF
ncbi:hypothetical protein PVAP13_9KG098160 [Panicum virgatum]|uniref:Uncharacterized protein n=1 Tax=Panicum virgatum TaxID=38727 RepID=A0A8T0NE65_PANVG|nr:hypothetical protein PVAP13_9KG098160 [Panicum virgatum]